MATNIKLSQLGNVLEYLSYPCNGKVHTSNRARGGSNPYTITWPNVTVAQTSTSSFALATGSTINYMPPPGTTKVIYRFCHTAHSLDIDSILLYGFFIDNVEVTRARFVNRLPDYVSSRIVFEWPITIDPNQNSPMIGYVPSWSANRNLQLQVRDYTASFQGQLHTMRSFDGANTFTGLVLPTLTLIALQEY